MKNYELKALIKIAKEHNKPFWKVLTVFNFFKDTEVVAGVFEGIKIARNNWV